MAGYPPLARRETLLKGLDFLFLRQFNNLAPIDESLSYTKMKLCLRELGNLDEKKVPS
jgi:hypothetical protein